MEEKKFDITMLGVAPFYITAKDLELLQSSENVSANIYTGLGLIAVIPALLKTFIANGFCEEVLFRGFISKRLINKFGLTSYEYDIQK